MASIAYEQFVSALEAVAPQYNWRQRIGADQATRRADRVAKNLALQSATALTPLVPEAPAAQAVEWADPPGLMGETAKAALEAHAPTAMAAERPPGDAERLSAVLDIPSEIEAARAQRKAFEDRIAGQRADREQAYHRIVELANPPAMPFKERLKRGILPFMSGVLRGVGELQETGRWKTDLGREVREGIYQPPTVQREMTAQQIRLKQYDEQMKDEEAHQRARDAFMSHILRLKEMRLAHASKAEIDRANMELRKELQTIKNELEERKVVATEKKTEAQVKKMEAEVDKIEALADFYRVRTDDVPEAAKDRAARTRAIQDRVEIAREHEKHYYELGLKGLELRRAGLAQRQALKGGITPKEAVKALQSMDGKLARAQAAKLRLEQGSPIDIITMELFRNNPALQSRLGQYMGGQAPATLKQEALAAIDREIASTWNVIKFYMPYAPSSLGGQAPPIPGYEQWSQPAPKTAPKPAGKESRVEEYLRKLQGASSGAGRVDEYLRRKGYAQ